MQSVMDTEDFRNSVLAPEFEKRGLDVCFATHSARQARWLGSRHPGKVAYLQPSIMAQVDASTRIEAVEFLGRFLPGCNVLNAMNDDPVFESKPLSLGLRHAAAVAGAYKSLFSGGRFSLFLSDNGYLYRRMAMAAALAKGVPMAPIESARIPGRFVVIDDFMGSWKGLDDAWRTIERHGIPQEILGEAEGYLDTFLEKGMVKAAEAHLGRPRFRTRAVATALRYIWRDIVEEGRLNPYTWSSVIIRRDVERRLRVMALGLAGYSEPVAGEASVFLPLPVPWETTLKHRAPLYEDPLGLIRTASRNIPPGCMLYVKEHPVNVGNTPISLLRTISRMENVRLITPEADSRELIRSSQGVITVNGTAGLEAILLGKRPMTLVGNFYDTFGFSDRITRGSEICRLVSSGGGGRLPTRADALKAAAAMIICTFKGSEYYSDPDNDLYDTTENASSIVDAILSSASPMTEFESGAKGSAQ